VALSAFITANLRAGYHRIAGLSITTSAWFLDLPRSGRTLGTAACEDHQVKGRFLPPTISEPQEEPRYNTRIQKGGALIEEMRQLVRVWQESPTDEQKQAVILANVLNKDTRARAADILRRTFIPRFVEGPIPNAWRLVRPLEDVEAPPLIVRSVYYWISAKAEPMIADFSREYLFSRIAAARAGVEQSEVLNWLSVKGCRWSPIVSIKVARGLLAALRDFGILEGHTHKRLANLRLPVTSFAYIAFCMQKLGSHGSQITFHSDWRLFLLSVAEVEYYLLEAHQQRLLEYHAAGNTVSLTFPCASLKEYASVISAGSN
jgi:hypothetical protein